MTSRDREPCCRAWRGLRPVSVETMVPGAESRELAPPCLKAGLPFRRRAADVSLEHWCVSERTPSAQTQAPRKASSGSVRRKSCVTVMLVTFIEAGTCNIGSVQHVADPATLH